MTTALWRVPVTGVGGLTEPCVTHQLSPAAARVSQLSRCPSSLSQVVFNHHLLMKCFSSSRLQMSALNSTPKKFYTLLFYLARGPLWPWGQLGQEGRGEALRRQVAGRVRACAELCASRSPGRCGGQQCPQQRLVCAEIGVEAPLACGQQALTGAAFPSRSWSLSPAYPGCRRLFPALSRTSHPSTCAKGGLTARKYCCTPCLGDGGGRRPPRASTPRAGSRPGREWLIS